MLFRGFNFIYLFNCHIFLNSYDGIGKSIVFIDLNLLICSCYHYQCPRSFYSKIKLETVIHEG